MKFKDMKQGFLLYILDKGAMTFLTEKVVSVSMPHIDAKMTAQGMVVDIATETNTYCMMAEAEVAYPSSKVVTTDKANILREVEAEKTTSEQALSEVEAHRQKVDRCKALIADLDPQQREKQENEARFSSLEKRLDRLMSLMEKGNTL